MTSHKPTMAVHHETPRRRRTTTTCLYIIAVLFSDSIILGFSWLNSHQISPRSLQSSRLSMAAPFSSDAVCSERAYQSFRDKNILLTGASGGLGQALALQLAHCNVQTLILSARTQVSLDEVAKQCQEISSTATIHIITCDLSNPDSVLQLGKEAVKLCNVDVLINCGGVSSRSRFIDTKPEVDATVMQINFLSGAALAKTVVPGMVEQKNGSIIWISSVQGLFGLPERTSYAASKFAVQGYCEALRGELASSGVTVYVASPGYIRTPLSRSAITGDGTPHGKMDSTTANGADPNDVAVDILNAVSKRKADFVVAATWSAKVAPWIRFFAPSLWNKILMKRFEKSRQTQDQDDVEAKKDN